MYDTAFQLSYSLPTMYYLQRHLSSTMIASLEVIIYQLRLTYFVSQVYVYS